MCFNVYNCGVLFLDQMGLFTTKKMIDIKAMIYISQDTLI
jgi:hypothetical protein